MSSPQLLTQNEWDIYTPAKLKQRVAAKLRDKPKYSSKVSARFTGTVYISCPSCGMLIKEKIRQKWVVECTNADCQKRYAVGLALWHLGHGKWREPMDRFPEACVEQYDRETVNRVLEAEQSNNGPNERSAQARVDGTGEGDGQEPRAKRAGSGREGLW